MNEVKTLFCGEVRISPTWPLPLSGKCQTVMENLTVNLKHGKCKGEVDSPAWFPHPGFDFGIRKRLMESPPLSRFGNGLLSLPAQKLYSSLNHLKKVIRTCFHLPVVNQSKWGGERKPR